MRRMRHDHHALCQLGVVIRWNNPVFAFALHGRGDGVSERNEADLRVARLGKLRRLRNILAQYEPL